MGMNSPLARCWIGLECTLDGKWSWDDQVEWSSDWTYYAPFGAGENPTTCDPESKYRHFLSKFGEWLEEDGLIHKLYWIVCALRPIGYNHPHSSTTQQTTKAEISMNTEFSSLAPDADNITEARTDPSVDATSESGGTTTEAVTTIAISIPMQTTSSPSTTITQPMLTSPVSTSTNTNDDSADFPLWAIFLIVSTVILLFVGIGIIVCRNRRQFGKTEVERNYNDPVKSHQEKFNKYYAHYLVSPGSFDEWEIERKFIGIDYSNKLGEGAFGCVYTGRFFDKTLCTLRAKSMAELAAARSDHNVVAVKMLHESANKVALMEFRSEIDLMKSIGYHERLVNLLACVTVSEPVQLISEYCSNGDLLSFMRQRREYMRINQATADESRVITAKKQIMFAIQIAYGLEYLSSRGFVHRDIAARNIMVDQYETCKIGDFGMCRLIGREAQHYRSQGEKLPLKWMPPEAIENYQFSAASDVSVIIL
ncbi:hypothetical protein PMAYCL1PPCAC_00063 [Pristionchus mayeri]|uniref:Protein kinase domain-containing protein n=1 Tax=Pristionchus mayeri TaxID=1317129 RepID=A0AAN5BYH4_9BILA|nr:hypothetical protein PMAYCL1PPCAC_00063 [Pristionchus mayeri]